MMNGISYLKKATQKIKIKKIIKKTLSFEDSINNQMVIRNCALFTHFGHKNSTNKSIKLQIYSNAKNI